MTSVDFPLHVFSLTRKIVCTCVLSLSLSTLFYPILSIFVLIIVYNRSACAVEQKADLTIFTVWTV